MRRSVYLACLVVLIMAMSVLPACDSSSSGGGAAVTGWSLADLAGVWSWRSGAGFSGVLSIDENGHVRSWSRSGGIQITPGVQFRVFSDGRVWFKGWLGILGVPGTAWYYRFNGKFINQGHIQGTLMNSTDPSLAGPKTSFRMIKH